MSAVLQHPVALAMVFTWIGFVCAISFMESWIKFRAPGVTSSIGLGIGRMVFGALNKVEWVLAIGVLGDLFFTGGRLLSGGHVFYFIPLFVLLMQTVWLLPALDTRAKLRMEGKSPLTSNIHYYYVGAEIVKLASLIVFGIRLFSINNLPV